MKDNQRIETLPLDTNYLFRRFLGEMDGERAFSNILLALVAKAGGEIAIHEHQFSLATERYYLNVDLESIPTGGRRMVLRVKEKIDGS